MQTILIDEQSMEFFAFQEKPMKNKIDDEKSPENVQFNQKSWK